MKNSCNHAKCNCTSVDEHHIEKARIALKRQQATSKNTSTLELELDRKQFPNHPPASIKLNTKLGLNHRQNNQLHINKNRPTRYKQSCRSRRNNRNGRAACITSSEGEKRLQVRATGGEHQDAGARENVPD